LSTKTHLARDGRGRPLAILIGPGQGGGCPMFTALLAAIRMPRIGPAGPAPRPEKAIADKAYSARPHRAVLRARRISAVIRRALPRQAAKPAVVLHLVSPGGLWVGLSWRW
jgi:transposase